MSDKSLFINPIDRLADDVFNSVPGSTKKLYHEVLSNLINEIPVDREPLILLLERMGPPKYNDKQQVRIAILNEIKDQQITDMFSPINASKSAKSSFRKAALSVHQRLTIKPNKCPQERALAQTDPEDFYKNMHDFMDRRSPD